MHETIIIDGKQIASELLDSLKQEIDAFKTKPGLAVVLVGDDQASQIYVRKKKAKAIEIGINSFVINFDSSVSEKELKAKILELNNDHNIHGILVQLPLPAHINTLEIINTIDPNKDVDGFTLQNIGKLILEQKDGLFPCTPLGCLHLIKTIVPDLRGANACVVGRSNIVGRPMANLLLNENCTVTNIHLETKNPIEIARKSDVLVVAAGHPGLITSEWVNSSTIVIDVGITRAPDGTIKGDVDYLSIKDKVKAITPVPGGVGPMTVAYLMKNTVKAYKMLL